MTFNEIEEKVLNLLKAISSSTDVDVSKPPIRVEDIAESFLGLKIVQGLSSNQKVSGMIQLAQKKIVVNSKEPEARRRFSIAHEIGHWILHAQDRDGEVVFRTRKSQDRVETEANAFAAAILMPRKLIYESLLQNLTLIANFETEWLLKILELLPSSYYRVFNKLLFSQFFQMNSGYSKKRKDWANTLLSLIPRMAKEFGVSKEALSVRMHILGLLSPICNRISTVT